jgi:hypothetical protein
MWVWGMGYESRAKLDGDRDFGGLADVWDRDTVILIVYLWFRKHGRAHRGALLDVVRHNPSQVQAHNQTSIEVIVGSNMHPSTNLLPAFQA